MGRRSYSWTCGVGGIGGGRRRGRRLFVALRRLTGAEGLDVSDQFDEVVFINLPFEGGHDRFPAEDDFGLGIQDRFADVVIIYIRAAAAAQGNGRAVEAFENGGTRPRA